MDSPGYIFKVFFYITERWRAALVIVKNRSKIKIKHVRSRAVQTIRWCKFCHHIREEDFNFTSLLWRCPLRRSEWGCRCWTWWQKQNSSRLAS